MGKIYGLCDLRIGKVGNLVFRKVENKNIVSEKPKYYPVNSAWLTREEFKQYVLSLLDVGIPQIYALSELPEDLYDYALIFVQTDEKCLVYLDKDGTRTQIRLEGGAADYDAVDIVNNLPQNPRNNTIYIKNDGDARNDTPTYTMYVCENDTLTKIDFGSKTITTSPPLQINDNDNISLNYNTSHFILKNDRLSADPIVTLIDDKQDKLVSGVNIRTIGGNSLVNANLMKQDIEPSDIMSLEKPLKWDINDSYKVKIGFNSNDFELDSDDNLKLKTINFPVTGAVSPLFLDSDKKVNIGVINGNGLKVANNNLQMGVNAPLYQTSTNNLALNLVTGNGLKVANNKLQMGVSAPLYQNSSNNLAFRYNTTDFSVTSNTFNASPLKTAIASDLVTLGNAITNLDSTTVKTSGNQTISGTKTFSDNIVGKVNGVKLVGYSVVRLNSGNGTVVNVLSTVGNIRVIGYGTTAPSIFLVDSFGSIPGTQRLLLIQPWDTSIRVSYSWDFTETHQQFAVSGNNDAYFNVMLFSHK